ncbi:hypothetical protein MPH_06051 [Macrophomina phaseolina MS6]|uniref:Uncharacterized protein n=1 Tax=Macrophomina phaseolina (strain MS6) TaxID=1126212 RepID=K2SIQ0_MACPH|nr:hypothetical protein MPH_06051 [Macrophomina phaseolina MS6]
MASSRRHIETQRLFGWWFLFPTADQTIVTLGFIRFWQLAVALREIAPVWTCESPCREGWGWRDCPPKIVRAPFSFFIMHWVWTVWGHQSEREEILYAYLDCGMVGGKVECPWNIYHRLVERSVTCLARASSAVWRFAAIRSLHASLKFCRIFSIILILVINLSARLPPASPRQNDSDFADSTVKPLVFRFSQKTKSI